MLSVYKELSLLNECLHAFKTANKQLLFTLHFVWCYIFSILVPGLLTLGIVLPILTGSIFRSMILPQLIVI